MLGYLWLLICGLAVVRYGMAETPPDQPIYQGLDLVFLLALACFFANLASFRKMREDPLRQNDPWATVNMLSAVGGLILLTVSFFVL